MIEQDVIWITEFCVEDLVRYGGDIERLRW